MLTQQQQAIVEQAPANTVVFAAPGSGKTTVLTNHLAWQISQGRVSAADVLALTFTRQSALDMKRRMVQHKVLNSVALQALRLGTFHAQAFRLLLQLRADIPVLLSPVEQFALMQFAAKRFGQGSVQNTRRWLLEQTRVRAVWPPQEPQDRLTRQVLQRYEALKVQSGRWDFEDILVTFATTLETTPELVRHIRYLLVDEYQDTNPLQWHVVQAIAQASGCPVFVVGDDDQSIYGFRGASPAGLLEFATTFPTACQHMLTTNFRSDRSIVSAAERLIRFNKERQEKQIQVSHSEEGECQVRNWRDEYEEAVGVKGLVEAQWQRNPTAQVAVLGRTRRQLAMCYDSFAAQPGRKPQFRTFHDAKGKEWDVVHIIGAVDDNPHLAGDPYDAQFPGQTRNGEEDRRLFYVAVTRARSALTIHVPLRMQGVAQQPIRYLAEAGLALSSVRHFTRFNLPWVRRSR